jgi:phosphatidylglycerol:prolipoprotein diacylglycerol transferase
MIPILFHIGPITVYSFGLMMALAFIIGTVTFTRELRRRGMDENLAGTITFIALAGGIIGSKVFHLIENPGDFPNHIFEPAGLTFYGGLIVAAAAIALFVRKKRIPFLRIADVVAPTLILCYGIGRIGCLLAGDGDYGTPTNLPWGMTFMHGTVKPTIGERDFFIEHPELDTVYHYTTASRILLSRDEFGPITAYDKTGTVHPAPLYETLYSLLFFVVLLRLQPRFQMREGWVFGLYLVLSGSARFLVEMIRINPRYAGLSFSQWLAVALAAGGAVLIATRRSRARRIVAVELITKTGCSLCEAARRVIEDARVPGIDVTETVIAEGHELWEEFWDKVPVVRIDGSVAFKYRVDPEEFSARLHAAREA